MRTSLTLALAAILCTLLSVPIVQAEEGRLQISQIKPTNRRAEETEEKFVKAMLSCVALALAPTTINAERQLRVEDATTPTPLDAFKVAIAKFEKKPARRFVQKFAKAMKKFKKNGRARRVEEDDTDYHIDSLMGLVNGRNGFPPNPVAM
ncbi:hypothetical protein GQ600_15535 [Phytophthora cactorum]|nr:hypothetical protein GQ600_15535 [Phytophthora cactorum]